MLLMSMDNRNLRVMALLVIVIISAFAPMYMDSCQNRACVVTKCPIGPLRGTMTITTIYGDGSVETRIVDVYQKGGGVVITRMCK